MQKTLLIALRVTAVTFVLTGILYPYVITGLAQLLFPYRANGSLVTDERGQVIEFPAPRTDVSTPIESCRVSTARIRYPCSRARSCSSDSARSSAVCGSAASRSARRRRRQYSREAHAYQSGPRGANRGGLHPRAPSEPQGQPAHIRCRHRAVRAAWHHDLDESDLLLRGAGVQHEHVRAGGPGASDGKGLTAVATARRVGEARRRSRVPAAGEKGTRDRRW